MIERLLVLGASGDLMERLLAPALAQLKSGGALPDGFSMLGVSTSDWDSAGFRQHIGDALEEHASGLDAGERRATLDLMAYQRGDATSAADLRTALGDADRPVAVYAALPPAILEATVRALIHVGLPDGSRIAIEKPFGDDLESARALNHLLHQAWPEPAVFRIDHFLAERAVPEPRRVAVREPAVRGGVES